ncbi:STAS domain-containing protein [Streptomyces erythrochromogenes]
MTSTLQTFDVAVSVQPGRAVVAVTGELDMDTCPQLAAATDALDLADQRLTVDLSHVTFMDCVALHQLLTLRRRALDQHGRLELSAIPDHALRMLDQGHVTRSPSARAAYSRPRPRPRTGYTVAAERPAPVAAALAGGGEALFRHTNRYPWP